MALWEKKQHRRYDSETQSQLPKYNTEMKSFDVMNFFWSTFDRNTKQKVLSLQTFDGPSYSVFST